MEFSWILQTLTTLVVGALAFFLKGNLSEIKDGIKKNAEEIKSSRAENSERIENVKEALEKKIEAERNRSTEEVKGVRQQMSELKDDLPFIYTTREDFIRFANGVDTKMGTIEGKIDKLLENMNRGKGEANG